MAAAIRMVMAVAVVVLPGAFVAVLAFLTFRTVRQAWLNARTRSQNGTVALKEVARGVNMKTLVREARAVAF